MGNAQGVRRGGQLTAVATVVRPGEPGSQHSQVDNQARQADRGRAQGPPSRTGYRAPRPESTAATVRARMQRSFHTE